MQGMVSTQSAVSKEKSNQRQLTTVDNALSGDLLKRALTYMDDELVCIRTIDPEGRLSGEVAVAPMRNLVTTVDLRPDGGFIFRECQCGSRRLCEHGLALLVTLLETMAQKKRWRSLQKKLTETPSWLCEGYFINLPISSGGGYAAEGWMVRGLEDLQAYWMLLDMASRPSELLLPAELLAAHTMKIYQDARWNIKRAAMDALLRRLASVKQEGLIVDEKPAGGAIFGNYRVRRKGGEPRPYEVSVPILPKVRSISASIWQRCWQTIMHGPVSTADFAKASRWRQLNSGGFLRWVWIRSRIPYRACS